MGSRSLWRQIPGHFCEGAVQTENGLAEMWAIALSGPGSGAELKGGTNLSTGLTEDAAWPAVFSTVATMSAMVGYAGGTASPKEDCLASLCFCHRKP